jgi:hypothetical protein
LSTKAKTEDKHVQQIRSLERRVVEANAKAKLEGQKREQAEQELQLAERRLELTLKTGRTKKAKPIRRHRKGTGQATAVICLTDWHCEETVESATVNGLNEYTLEIAKQRIERTFRKALYLLEFARGISDIRELVVWLGGDFITGYIHEELEESNQLSPVEAVQWAQHELYSGLTFLADHAGVSKIRVPTSYGNHGRTTGRTRVSTRHRNSFEWLLYRNLAQQLGKPFEFTIQPGYHSILDIQGHKTRFHHGDAIRYQGGVGGITIPVNKAIAQWNKSVRCEYDFFGHYHQFLETWGFVSVGCLIGYNAYALEIKADYQAPSQAFAVIDREYGKVMALPIFCDKPVV